MEEEIGCRGSSSDVDVPEVGCVLNEEGGRRDLWLKEGDIKYIGTYLLYALWAEYYSEFEVIVVNLSKPEQWTEVN